MVIMHFSPSGNRKAGPDGGNGGTGGNIVLEADISVRQLRHVNKHLKSENGEPGRKGNCHGKNGKNLVVKVMGINMHSSESKFKQA